MADLTGTESLYLEQPEDRTGYVALPSKDIQTLQADSLCSEEKLLRMPTFSQLDGRLWLRFLQWVHTARLYEIPYKFQQRTEGESKLSGKVTIRVLKAAQEP